MDKKQALTDRRTALSVVSNLEGTLANFKIFFEELEKLKVDIFAKTERKDDIISYFTNCDCDFSWEDIVVKYQEFKKIYDYLKERE